MNSDPLPSIDLTPPPPGSDQAILQNSSQATEKTEDNLLALKQSQGEQPVPQQDQGIPPMHQMPDGTMMPGASHQGGQPQQEQQPSIYDAIAQHEGFRDEAYDDGTGVWTIGFGRTYNADGTKVKKGQVSNRAAEQSFLNARVDEDKQYVQDYAAKHGYDWNDNQVNALTSFTYNLGKGGLDKLTANGSRDNNEILSKLPEYNKAGGKFLEGLQIRRNDEAALFGGAAPVATPTGAPGYDEAGLGVVSPGYQPSQSEVPADDRWFGGLRDSFNTYQNNVGSTYDAVPQLPGVPSAPSDANALKACCVCW